ncbi:MAG: radical SAM protein [bacterium]
MLCNCCPFECHVDRSNQLGICKAPGDFKIAKSMAHFWEEPCISGTRGSGTIFFSHCNASCIFCQNYKISHKGKGHLYTQKQFFTLCQNLVEKHNVHNINFVSPTHYSLQLIEILPQLKKKLRIPIVWNSNAYEKVETLNQLNGTIDVFLPDLKYFHDSTAQRFSRVPDYFRHASQAIITMKNITGKTLFDHEGLMQRGLLIRHLVLPGHVNESKNIIRWIAENLGNDTYVSLMAQYYPTYKASESPPMNRTLTPAEYQEIEDFFFELGFYNGFVQSLDSHSSCYTPEF